MANGEILLSTWVVAKGEILLNTWPMERYYCIVLYLCIYTMLLAVHTNQKRFQCERSREKRAVNKVDRVEGRIWFQSAGPTIAKACVCYLRERHTHTERQREGRERVG